MLVDLAVLHDEIDLVQDGDVLQGVAGDGDHVGAFAGLEAAQPAGLAQQLRRLQGRGGVDPLPGSVAAVSRAVAGEIF